VSRGQSPPYEQWSLSGAPGEERCRKQAPVEIFGAAEDGEGEQIDECREAGEVVRFGGLATKADECQKQVEPKQPAGGVKEQAIHARGEQHVVESAEAEPLGEARGG